MLSLLQILLVHSCFNTSIKNGLCKLITCCKQVEKWSRFLSARYLFFNVLRFLGTGTPPSSCITIYKLTNPIPKTFYILYWYIYNTTLTKCHGKRAIYINGFISMSQKRDCTTLIKPFKITLKWIWNVFGRALQPKGGIVNTFFIFIDKHKKVLAWHEKTYGKYIIYTINTIILYIYIYNYI